MCDGDSSSEREIYSGVPQDAKWSPLIWDFDISELPAHVSDQAEVGCYADDMWLWYEITPHNMLTLVDTINDDLERLTQWAASNKTTFEPDKTSMMLVTKKHAN